MRAAEFKVMATLAILALAIIAVAAAALSPAEPRPLAPATVITATAPDRQDTWRAQLRHCQDLGEAGPRDAQCRRLWAESRDRFLGLAPTSR